MTYSLMGQVALATLMLSFGVAGGWEIHALVARPWNGCAFAVAKSAEPSARAPRIIVPSPGADKGGSSDWRSVTDF